MNNNTSLADVLKNNVSKLASKKVTAGFDGFIDTLIRTIKSKQEGKEPEFFTSINEFGQYIISKSSGNCSIEYEVINTKFGGNMPITSNALGNLGVHVNCIGAFGYPQARMIFNTLSQNCTLHSFTEPGIATAYEFKDGKIIFGEAKALNSIGWNELKNIIGIEKLIHLFKESDLFCLLNWSEIDTSTNIWKGILNEILPAYKNEKNQIAFFDLSDCSKRSNEAILEMIALLQSFSKYAKVILSLNRNESRMIYKVLFNENATDDFKTTCTKLYGKLGIDMLVFHSSATSYVFTKNNCVAGESFFIKDPLFSTGAGDNFNAGFIAAQLLALNAEESLLFANAIAAQYIQTGISPTPENMISFLEKNIKA
jgi:sugar/nucleoside kinase (ribokinase family)